MPKLSIVIPIYNIDKHYFNKCMQSILEQSFNDIEVILVNDGSTNGCDRICDEFKLKDDRIIVIHQENSGVSVSRNKGIESSNSEYIVFVDPDDWMEPNSFEKMYQESKKYNSDLVIFSYFENYVGREINHCNNEVREIKFNKCDHEILQLNILNYKNKFSYINSSSVWAKCYKRSFLQENNIKFLEGQTKSQDTLFNLEVIERANKITYSNSAVYHYRQSEASVCHRMNRKIDYILINVCYKVKEFIEKNNKGNEFYEAHNLANIYIYKQILLLNYFHKHNKEKISVRKQQWLKLINNDEISYSLNNVNKNLINKKDKLIILLTKYKQFEILSFLYSYKNKFKKDKINNFE